MESRAAALVPVPHVVVVVGRERARSNTTGLTYDTPMAHVYEFDDQGRVAQFTELIDSASVVAAASVGLRPADRR